MLPKSSRLNLKKDFKWVAGGEKVENELLKVFWRSGQNPLPRLGIAVSSTTFKKAVQRNRARRLVSSGFEFLYSQLLPHLNLIAFPKEGVLKISSKELRKTLENLLREVKLLNL
ncbi:MAG: ribonuclease P protein component [bacterium]|nr:ribonuclease P protein component [bacterium]